MAKVKVGLIGIGKMGSFHARILSELKEAKLVGIFDVNEIKAQDAANHYRINCYSSYELLLKDVEAVIIATPTSTHASIAKDCILAGKHLLIEKPLAENSQTASQIIELCKNRNSKFSVGMIERFNPAFQRLEKEIKGQKIIGIEIKRLSPFPERIKESVVFDMMIHDIDLALKLNQSGIDEIRAYGKKTRSETLDEVFATLYFKDGLIAKLDASRLKNYKERKIIITTDRFIYEADLLNRKLLYRSFDDLVNKTEFKLKTEDQLEAELRSYVSSIQKDRPPEIPIHESFFTLKTAEEIEKIACS